MAKVIEFKGNLLVYEENPTDIRSIQGPPFYRSMANLQGFSAYTIQWPPTFKTSDRRNTIERFVRLLEGLGGTHVSWKESGQVRNEEGLTAFLNLIDTDPWWLGDVVAITQDADQRAIIIFPGSDGAFLHIFYAPEYGVNIRTALNLTFS